MRWPCHLWAWLFPPIQRGLGCVWSLPTKGIGSSPCLSLGWALSPLDVAVPHIQRGLGCPSAFPGHPPCLPWGSAMPGTSSLAPWEVGKELGLTLAPGWSVGQQLRRAEPVANEVWAGSRWSTSTSISAAAKIQPCLGRRDGEKGWWVAEPAAALGQ